MDTKKKIPTFKEIFKKEWHQQTAKDKTRIIKFIVETTHILYFCGIYSFRNKFY